MSGYRAPADARLAASLLLLRDRADGQPGLEVLMLRRAERDGDMRSGVAVFPGGVLDARDREAHEHSIGPGDAAASAALGLAEGGLDYWVAAVRESFEEVGLLLAQGGEAGFDLAAFKPWRDRLQTGAASMADFCRAEGLRLDLRELVYFSHWLTPPGQPRRFDTRFFAAPAPPGQVAEADLGEALELMWLTPHEALAPQRGLKLLPVTQRTLHDLGNVCVCDLLDRWRDADALVQPSDRGDEIHCEGPGVVAVTSEPACLREFRHLRGGVVHVEVEYVREQDRVQVPVREVVERAELVGDRVDVPDAHLGEGEPSET